MGSSNRHWPSMFKSKPTNTTTHHQCHHDRNPGCEEERAPEPKPRWNPRPEQIRILEAIFNSGMVNPPRDEIRRIRGQLQEFGQVGDANVFYWFQNRKSRTKHKQRHLKPSPSPPPVSSSSSSNKSSPSCNSNDRPLSLKFNPSSLIEILNSPSRSVNQPLMAEPVMFGGEENWFPENVGNNVLVGDAMQMNIHGCPRKGEDDDETMKIQQRQISSADPSVVQGIVEPKSTVFINDVCFQVAIGAPFNVREAFGYDVILVDSSGQPLATDEWGVTHQPLRHGAFYYLRSISNPHNHIWYIFIFYYKYIYASESFFKSHPILFSPHIYNDKTTNLIIFPQIRSEQVSNSKWGGLVPVCEIMFLFIFLISCFFIIYAFIFTT